MILIRLGILFPKLYLGALALSGDESCLLILHGSPETLWVCAAYFHLGRKSDLIVGKWVHAPVGAMAENFLPF